MWPLPWQSTTPSRQASLFPCSLLHHSTPLRHQSLAERRMLVQITTIQLYRACEAPWLELQTADSHPELVLFHDVLLHCWGGSPAASPA